MGSSMQEYLQKYIGSGDKGASGGKVKSKKSKRSGKNGGLLSSRGSNSGSGLIIVDDDALWQKEVKAEDDDEPEADGDAPLVIEDVEVKRMQRMEARKEHRPYLSVANDGSGWVHVKGDDPQADAGDSRVENAVKGLALRVARQNSADVSAPTRRSDSPDLSPPRRRNHSPESAHEDSLSDRKRKFSMEGLSNEGGDLSPPRQRRNASDLSPPRNSRDSRISFGERRRHDTPPPTSSQRRRQDSPSLSPPRRKVRHDSPTLSPPRKRRHDSPSPPPPSTRRRLSPSRNAGSDDLDPPRKRRISPPKNADSDDLSPPRRRRDSPSKKSSGPGDLSPPRRRRESPARRNAASDDLSPPRRDRVSSASVGEEFVNLSSGRSRGSPPRRRRHDSPEMSIREHSNSADPSSSARARASMDSSPPRKPKSSTASLNQSGQSSPPRKKAVTKMADGTLGGLKSVRDVASDAERIKAAEAKLLSELDPSLSGRGAETVFRDKRGRRLEGLEELMRQQKGGGKPAEQPLEWGKGLAQKKVASAALAELEAEKDKPFARYRDDAELDRSLRDAVRFGDPMAHLVKQKTVEPVLEDLGARDEMKASGFIVPQDIPKHSWLKTGAAAPPNRYGIRPGRHWDGVDRSTGHESDMFKQRNEKKAREQEAYLWSVADM